MSHEIECKDCANSRKSYGGLLCLADIIAKPAESVRDYRGRCGIEALLFEPKKEEKKCSR